MSKALHLRVGDRVPYFFFVIRDNGGQPVDLTGATVTFTMKRRDTASVKVDAAAVTVTDAANGEGEYRWAAGDTDTEGAYEATVKVTFPGGEPSSFPKDEKAEVVIRA